MTIMFATPCSDNILYENPNKCSNDNREEQMNEHSQINHAQSLGTDTVGNGLNNTPQNQNSDQSTTDDQLNHIPSLEANDASSKPKPKRAPKPNKTKKEEVYDKSYIPELESQVNMLKSTIELYKKRNEQLPNNSSDTTGNGRDGSSSGSCKMDNGCNHSCCSCLAEKIQDDRLRFLETQMMQNMFINNAVHMQLSAQIRSSIPMVPIQTIPTLNHSLNNAYISMPVMGNFMPYQNPMCGPQQSTVPGQATRPVYTPQPISSPYVVHPGFYGIRPLAYPPMGPGQIPVNLPNQMEHPTGSHTCSST